jgi:hypothetical protein
MLFITVKSKFPLGEIVITPNALSTLSEAEVNDGLCRHAKADWGDVYPEDAEQNFNALESGGRLFSAYGQGPKRFWIITEFECSVTTILLPLDY